MKGDINVRRLMRDTANLSDKLATPEFVELTQRPNFTHMPSLHSHLFDTHTAFLLAAHIPVAQLLPVSVVHSTAEPFPEAARRRRRGTPLVGVVAFDVGVAVVGLGVATVGFGVAAVGPLAGVARRRRRCRGSAVGSGVSIGIVDEKYSHFPFLLHIPSGHTHLLPTHSAFLLFAQSIARQLPPVSFSHVDGSITPVVVQDPSVLVDVEFSGRCLQFILLPAFSLQYLALVHIKPSKRFCDGQSVQAVVKQL